MRARKKRQLAENIAGSVMVALGLTATAFALWYHREQILPQLFNEGAPGEIIEGEPVEAGVVSGAALQQRIEDVQNRHREIEEARVARVRAALEAQRKAEEEERRRIEEEKRKAEEARLAAEKAAAEQAAKEKAEREAKEKAEAEKAAAAAKAKAEKEKAEKAAKEKAAAEKAAAEKAAKEKAAAEKAAKEKAAAEKAAAEKIAAEKRRAAEKAAREAEAKAAAAQARLDALSEPTLELSSVGGSGGGGSGGTGLPAAGDVRNAALEAFRAAAIMKVLQRWVAPQNIAGGLSASVVVKVDRNGRVGELRLVEKSGNTLYDDSVLTAVRKASPLPMPKDRDLVEELVREGIRLNF